jgi:hypothetical protein
MCNEFAFRYNHQAEGLPDYMGIGYQHMLVEGCCMLSFRIMHILVGTRDGRTQSASACKLTLLHLALKTWVSGPRQI